MKEGFVGTKHVSSEELSILLDKLSNEQSYYFVRSPHAISGISMKRPADFASFEGQMFNCDREVRWKKQKDGYEVLLLSRIKADLDLGFEENNNHWEICDRAAYWYRTKDSQPSQFPKKFLFIGTNGEEINPDNIPIGQRYFRNSKTATVHFVALMVSNENE